MSESQKGHIPWNKGRNDYLTPELREKMGVGNIGKKSPKKGKPQTEVLGNKNGMWKGDDAGYSGLHYWVKRRLGIPKECMNCGETKKKLEWANIDHSYKRKLADWISLCRSCHRKHDIINNGYVPYYTKINL